MSFVVRAAIAVATMGVSSILAAPMSFAGPPLLPVDPSFSKPAVSLPVSPFTLGQRMEAAIQAAMPGAEVGIKVIDLGSGVPLAGLNEDQQFYTASVVKLLIALAALDDEGKQPDSATTASVQRMLAVSDDNIATRLWAGAGGAELVTRLAGRLGLTGTQPPASSGQWGQTLTTARDVVEIYRYIAAGAPDSPRALIREALGRAEEIAADGVDQYFGIPTALSGTPWAVKQGWMWMGSSITLHTTGLVGRDLRYAVVVLTSQPTTSVPAGGAALTAGVEELRTALTGWI